MDKIKTLLDDMGIKNNIDNTYALIEFWTDTAGQDIPVEIDFDGTVEDLVHKFSIYAENYNVDEEVELYVNMRGQNGVPSTIRELLDDCQEAKDTLLDIAKKMESALNCEVTIRN